MVLWRFLTGLWVIGICFCMAEIQSVTDIVQGKTHKIIAVDYGNCSHAPTCQGYYSNSSDEIKSPKFVERASETNSSSTINELSTTQAPSTTQTSGSTTTRITTIQSTIPSEPTTETTTEPTTVWGPSCSSPQCTGIVSRITAGGEWISFDVFVTSCILPLDGIEIQLEADEGRMNTTAPLDCLEERSAGYYNFNSSRANCTIPSLLECTSYTVTVTTLFEVCKGEPNQLTVWNQPFRQVNITVEEMTDNYFGLSWSFPSNLCTEQVDRFKLIFKDVDNRLNYTAEFDNSCFEQTDVINFNTSNACFDATIDQCNTYIIEIIPVVNGVSFAKLGGSAEIINPVNYEKTVMTVKTEEFNENSITFRWNVNQSRCMNYVDGFTLKVVDVKFSKNQTLFANRGECFNVSSGEVSFATTGPCSNVTVDPCTDYTIEVIPKMFGEEYVLRGNAGKTTMAPGDTYALIEDFETNDTSIGISWTASNPRCFSSITGFQLALNDKFTGSQIQNITLLGSCVAQSEDSIWYSTQSSCYNWTVEPCVDYSVAITPYFYSRFAGGLAEMNATTPPDPNMETIVAADDYSSNPIEITWTLSNDRCLNYIVGFDLDVINLDEKQNQSAFIPSVCFNTTAEGISFDTGNPCSNISLQPCTNYLIKVVPQLLNYHETLEDSYDNTTTTADESVSMSVETGLYNEESIEFSWTVSDDRCMNYVSGFKLTVVDLESPQNQTVHVERDKCFNVSSSGVFFDTAGPCSNITVEACTDYLIEIVPSMFGKDYAFPGNNNFTTTSPGSDITTEILTLEADDESISISWKVSSDKCHDRITGFQFAIIDSFKEQVQNVSIDCAEDSDGAISFNTITNCSTWIVESCLTYSVAITPYFFDRFARFANGNVSTLPDPNMSVIVKTDSYNDESIQFTWTFSEPRCLNYLEGFTLNLVDFSDLKLQSEFISDCSTNSSDGINFDTASPCSGFDTEPCTDYSIEIIPQMFGIEYRFNGMSKNTTTGPGDSSVKIESLEADGESLSFSFTISNERCFPRLTGFLLNLDDEYFGSQNSHVPLECAKVADGTVSFSTNSNCSSWVVEPCITYNLGINPLFFNIFQGTATNSSVATRPGDNITMELSVDDVRSESALLSWTLSQSRCLNFVKTFALKVTDLADNSMAQNCDIGDECFDVVNGRVVFDTSCDKCVKIVACSDYSLEVVPYILDDSFPELDNNFAIIHTVPGSDIKAIVVSTSSSTDWISFRWAASKPKCRQYVSAFNVTITNSAVIQEVFVTGGCFDLQTDGIITFNSSNSCNESVAIHSCSSYTITIVPQFDDQFWGSQSSNMIVSRPEDGEDQISNLISTDQSMDSITLNFTEPRCRNNIDLKLYIVSIIELWGSLNQRILTVPSSCVIDGSLTLGPATCNRTGLDARLHSCSPYRISILPSYDVEDISPTAPVPVETFTQRSDLDGLVNDFKTLQPLGSNSIHLQWQRPRCNYPIRSWDFSVENRGITNNFSIPYDCPAILGETYTFLLRENVSCANNQVLPILPCYIYDVRIEAKFPDLNSDGSVALSYSTPSEHPGEVSNIVYQIDKENKSIEISWSEPLEHPQCVAYYQIFLINESYAYNSSRAEPSATFDHLDPCATYNVTVLSIRKPNIKASAEESAQIAPFGDSECENSVVGLALGITFAVLVILVASGVAYRYRRQVVSRWNQYRQGAQQPAPSVSIASVPIANAQFSARLRELEADGGWGFSDEFKKLQTAAAAIKETYKAAEAPANACKNRYVNILPYDRTRVKLSKLLGDPHSDYINASLITGFGNQAEAYIAAQGPVDDTIADFWRTIWEKSVMIIVMVTPLEERGKAKCAKYWPSIGQEQYDEISVTIEDEILENAFIQRKFQVAYAGDSRTVWQMHFTNWPDFGCPEDPTDMIELVMVTRAGNERLGGNSPILVHCSAGVGRSGTFIALDMLMRSAEVHQRVDVMKTVLSLRKERVGMVQTEDQYRFIYKCLDSYIQSGCAQTAFPNEVMEFEEQIEARNPTFPVS